MLDYNVEVKFGNINSTFPGINKSSFIKLLNTFNFTDKSLSTIYFNNNIKKIITDNLTVIYKNKQTINYIYNSDYNLHYFYTVDKSIEDVDDFNSNYSKEKLKYNYTFNKDINLELSEVIIKSEDTIINTYEVELKYKVINNNYDEVLFDKIIKQIVKLLQNSDCLYTTTIYNNLIADIKDYSLVKTRNIDINNFDVKELMVVSTKAKGKRCMLVIHSTGVWFVKSPYYYNLIININNPYYNYFVNSFNLSLFDGELVTPMNKNRYEFNYKYWFLCYDCLAFNKSDVRKLNYGERIDYAKVLKKLITWYIDSSLLTVNLKTWRAFNNKEELSKNINYLLTLGPVLNYQHNGLIFTPVLQPYNSTVYKWVYPEMLTIDFAIYPDGKDVKLYLYNEDVKEDVEFVGTTNLPFDKNMILQDSFRTIN